MNVTCTWNKSLTLPQRKIIAAYRNLNHRLAIETRQSSMVNYPYLLILDYATFALYIRANQADCRAGAHNLAPALGLIYYISVAWPNTLCNIEQNHVNADWYLMEFDGSWALRLMCVIWILFAPHHFLYEIQIMLVAIFFTIFRVQMIISFIIKVEFLVLIKWSYLFLELHRLSNLEWLAQFEHVFQSLFTIHLFSVYFVTHT